MQPKISIVGAGPGDPELITLKGAKAIQSADAILYDALVNDALLGLAPEGCELIYVGKRAGEKYLQQDEIKLLMVQTAFSHGHVVRLKGGDPMVFGRGHEELDYAKAFGVPTEIVPGISSALAVPMSQQVPLTHRGLARSFWVVTATAAGDELNTDLHLAAQSSATVVILMGIGRLAKIVELFKAAGKKNTPAMIVQNATLPDEKYVVSSIDHIVADAAKANIGTPGTIIVGDVVSLHHDLVIASVQHHMA